MKKFISLFLCTLVFFSCIITSFAVTGKDERTPAPVISDLKTVLSEKGADYSVTFTDSASEAEMIRDELYSVALSLHGSEEKLKNSNESYLCYKTKLYCEISTDKENWLTLKEISASFSVSLYNEILPLLRENGADFKKLYKGFEFYIRVLMASENFREENTETVYVYTPSQEKTLTAPAFSYIHTELPEGVTLSEEIPCYFTGELQKDINLPVLTKTGYTFDGWSSEYATRINKIEKGTEAITVTAHFMPKTYEINYVITKNFDTHFGRVDLSKHPTSYTVGEGAKIPSLSAPLGYVFCGWYKNEDFTGEKVTEISAEETGDVLLWAKWITTDRAVEIIRQKEAAYIKEQKFGDPDGDGKITAADARYVLRSVVGLEELSYETLKRVDYYQDGRISSINARTTLRIAVKLEDLHEILSENGLLPIFNWE